jgi:Trypsin
MHSARKTLLAAVLVATAGMTAPAQAIVTASGTLPALPAGLNLGGVGLLSNGCSAVLLDGGGWILASGHCAAGAGATVGFAGGATATIAQTVLAPDFNPEGVNDLSLSRLDSPVSSIAGYGIAASPAFPASVLAAGYGAGGSGSTGASLPGGVLRWGVNEYDELLADEPPIFYGGRLVAFDLDSGLAVDNRSGGLGLGAGEAGLAGGDSGGPSFALVAGVWSIVGIHTGVDEDLGFGFGGISYDTLTAPYAGWIAQVTAVPEPAPAALLAAGLLLLAGLQSARGGRATRVSNFARFTLK